MSFKKIILPLLLVLFLVGCLPDTEVSLVKDGMLDACPQKTVGEMATEIGAPSWQSLVAEDGKTYVNLSGKITFNEKPVDALIQFLVHERGDTFEINAFEMNGVSQNLLMLNGLLTNMCDA